MKIDRIYIAGYRDDLRFTQCCVASIRHWYPRIPICLIKDESPGTYDTRELERVWDVTLFETGRKSFGWGWSKLEPLFRPAGERCLILDSDTVFVGRVLERLEASAADFVAARTPASPEDIRRDYFDLARLAKFDPQFIFPNFTFNTGQLVATTGILTRADFESLVDFSDPPRLTRPDIFRYTDQGVLNYVLQKRCQEGSLSLERVEFMWWAGWLKPQNVKARKLADGSGYPYLVHWAGPKGRHFGRTRNGHILRYFASYYDSRVAHGGHPRWPPALAWLYGALSVAVPSFRRVGRRNFQVSPGKNRSE